MKQQVSTKNQLQIKAFAVISVLLLMIGIMAFALDNGEKAALPTYLPSVKKDSIASVKAFKQFMPY